MTTNKVIKISLLVMVVLNVTLLFFLMNPPNHPPQYPKETPGPLFQRISEKLQLTPEQQQSFERMAMEHREKMHEIENRQATLVNAYFETLKHEETTEANRLLTQITKQEASKLQITYAHFQDLKNLLNPSQKADFQLIVEDVLKVIVNQSKVPPPPFPEE